MHIAREYSTGVGHIEQSTPQGSYLVTFQGERVAQLEAETLQAARFALRRMALTAQLRVGQRVILTQDVERYPHFTARSGATGVLVDYSATLIAVRMDAPLEGAEAWDNEVHWTDDEIAQFPGDVIALVPVDFDDVRTLAEEAFNAAVRTIQDRLGVAGDVAGLYFNDGADETIRQQLMAYIRAEVAAL